MSVLALLLLWLLLLLLGRGICRFFPEPANSSGKILVWTLAGLIGLHAVLTTLDLLGAPWSLGSLALMAVGGGVLNLGRPSKAPLVPGLSWSWGLAVAAASSVVLAWVVASLWSTNPDFVYHWGVKGHRFFLEGGVDESFLQKSWNRLAHPDYPLLQPQLFVVTASLRGFFDESAMLVQAALWCLLSAVAARQAMAAAGASSFAVESTSAAVGLTLAMFSIAQRLGGGPDPILSLVLVAAAASLLEPPRRGEGRRGIGPWDLQIALAAAVGAAAKVEGVPLAVFVLSAYGLRQGLWRRPWPLRRLALLALPCVVVVVPWWLQAHRLQLFGRLNAGPFNLDHWSAIWPELLRSLLHPHWYGLPVLLAVTLPLVVLDRRVRPLVMVCLAQLGLYVYVYFTALRAPEIHVRTSFTRILCHVVPVLLVAASLAFDGWVRRRAERKGQKAPVSARPQTFP